MVNFCQFCQAVPNHSAPSESACFAPSRQASGVLAQLELTAA